MHTPVTPLIVATVASLMLASAYPAARQQAPARDERPFRSGIELTSLTLTVTDHDGHLVTGLPRDGFEVSEDGQPQEVTQFTNERVPISLALLLDTSDSMFGKRIADARSAVDRFLLDLLAPSDEFLIMAFNHQPHVLTTWTHDPTVVRKALDALHPSGATALYDAVLRALPLTEHRGKERTAILVLSDGADTASDATIRDVRSALRRVEAFVYAIAIDSPEPQPINTRVNAGALREVTDESGGRTEIVHSSADLAAATAGIAQELNSQYVLGYVSSHGPDGQFHSIRVKVGGTDYRVRARRGYVATRRP